MSKVYLNGRFVPTEEALISPDDRGFLLSDGVYEVIPFYEGVPMFMDRHLERLRRSLDELRIEYDATGLSEVLTRRTAIEPAPPVAVNLETDEGRTPEARVIL